MKSTLVRGRVAFGDASLNWLQEAGRVVYGQMFDARATLFASFTSIYSAVRLYHGTRVDNPESFRETGILPSDIDSLNERAFELFGVSEEVSQVIKNLKLCGYTAHNEGKIFVCLDPCACLTYDYCWRGSEYLTTIGNRVGKPEKIRATGTPTLLGFNVTIEELGEEQINSIAGQAIGSLYENWRRPGSINRAVDFGFPLFKPVMPYQIREVLPLEDKA